jgi:hypothetical protein
MRNLVVLILLFALPAPVRADCSGGATPTGKPCGAIDFAGCCRDGSLYFCEAGELCALSCEKIPQCGWNGAKGFYDCDTTGTADPDLLYPLECPAMTGGQCQGVDYAGCCAGETVYWCDGKQLHGYDCSHNSTQNVCGTNAAVSVADCVAPGGPEFKSCPFPAGSVALPEVPGQDVVTGDVASVADIQLSTDGLSVPDIAAPSNCTTLAPRYTVANPGCEMLGGQVLTLQDGCAALLVGLAPEAAEHPVAKVTASGLAFWFAKGGLEYNCTGSFSGSELNGQCFWGNGGECTFSYQEAEIVSPEPEGPTKGTSSGCTVTDSGVVANALLVMALLLSMAWRRRWVA